MHTPAHTLTHRHRVRDTDTKIEVDIVGKTLPLRTTHFVKLNCELRFTISRKGPE